MSAPGVYAAVHAVAADLASVGIAKSRTNKVDQYKYRSIDDVLDSLAPLLAKHRLCVFPNALERAVTERRCEGEGLLLHVALKVAFNLTCVDDGTSHIVQAYGEALDAGDKATAKAMSAAFKSAMIQTFCIPIPDAEDVDRMSHRLLSRKHDPEPIQGWRQWVDDIADIVGACESDQAIDTVQERYRDLLKALSRERPELYVELGRSFASRRETLQTRRERPDSTLAPGRITSKQARKKSPVSVEV